MSFVRINGILDKFDEFVLLTQSASNQQTIFLCVLSHLQYQNRLVIHRYIKTYTTPQLR